MTRHLCHTPISWELAVKNPSRLPHAPLRIGVLALQGDFLEHILTLNRMGISSQEVRLPSDLDTIDGLILPGGESTTIARLIDVFDIRSPLLKKIHEGLPVWGTCAGMILLARELSQDRPIPLGVLDIVVNRNAFGSQQESFEEELRMNIFNNIPFHATFIRAPSILKTGPAVQVLGTLSDGTIVAVKEQNILGTSFHPELTEDVRFHTYFLSLVHNTLIKK